MAKKAALKTEDINSKLVEELLSKSEPGELFGKDGLFTKLKKQVVEKMLSSEVDHELGYSKHSKVPKSSSNRRNGSYTKTDPVLVFRTVKITRLEGEGNAKEEKIYIGI